MKGQESTRVRGCKGERAGGCKGDGHKGERV